MFAALEPGDSFLSTIGPALAQVQQLGLKDRDEASNIIARYIVQGATRGKYDPKLLADGAIGIRDTTDAIRFVRPRSRRGMRCGQTADG
jgi:hypothetical protein